MVEQEAIEIPDFRNLLWQSLTPGAAPLEGRTRIKVQGESFADDSTVTVGGNPATEVRMADAGKLLFATLPSGTEGVADVVITTSGQPDKTISPGVQYVTDVVETARAVIASFIVHLTELRDLAQSMATFETLDENARRNLRLELELAHRLSYEAIEDRAAEGGGAADSPGVVDVLEENGAMLSLLLDQAITAIG